MMVVCENWWSVHSFSWRSLHHFKSLLILFTLGMIPPSMIPPEHILPIFPSLLGKSHSCQWNPPQKNLGSISSIPFQKISPNITFELLSGSELPMFRKLHESIPGARGAWGWWVAVAALDDGLSSGGRRATAWSHSGGRSQESAVEELRRGEIWWFWAVDPLLLDDQRWLVSLY